MTSENAAAEPESSLQRLRLKLRKLYHGRTTAALRFQIAVTIVDLAIIVFFIVSPLLRDLPSFLWIDYSVAALLAADIAARAFASSDVLRWLRQATVLVDIFVLVTLLFPYTLFNLGFLRILRLWSLSRSGVLWAPLERNGYGEWRDVVHAVMNLLTFLFIVTGFVYTSFFSHGPTVEGYVDALYFTVATVTTTGFGDIVLPGVWGKLTAIVTMIIGISLFVRLAQSIFRPVKVFFPCPQCGLQRHDKDAVFCKACGNMLNIPNDDE
ncbi:potassium channel family protein [Aquamicrobium sp. LC103]|uniref:potassium channel family protein n=1 Tax=Aquamicrobium sp. LC103 TaxID=1120658 RepID=UPI00063E72C0|nr:potassium channel family protein [Aquamicrobium sp. LC103]TKT80379.1 potassium channel family protein [Aquamicrobium sp. LC103]